jgi:YidC/Oxa1 family membrane protein insertase
MFVVGWFLDPLYNVFGAILAFFYSLVPNLGVAIILMTVAVMLAMFPLTAKQAKSMMAMQRAQPEIKKLQAKYKGDRQKLNEEMMKFYQENHINPLSGCFPLLVQLPVFFALFRVLREPYLHIPKSSSLYAAFCTNKAGQVVGQSACGKGKLPNAQYFLGMNLSQHATGVTTGFVDALPYFILVALVFVTGFAQSRQNRRNSPNMTGQMAMITNIMPMAFALFSLQFPAGLVLYFLVSNIWRLGQQELIMHKITRPGMAAAGAIDVKGAVVADKSPPGGEVTEGKPGGLRKLFQLPTGNGAPPAANGDGAAPPAATAPDSRSGTRGNGGDAGGEPPGGTARPPAKQPTKASTSSRAAKPATGGSAPAGARSSSSRRSNKKRKRR